MPFMKMKDIIEKRLDYSKTHCAFKTAFIPKGWTCVNIKKCSEDLEKELLKEIRGKEKLYFGG